MALGKKRGRKPSKRTAAARTELQKKRHWLDCVECEIDGAQVDGDVTSFICSTCVAGQVAPPEMPKPALTPEEKEARAARKTARKERKDAIARGEVPEGPVDLGFGRGWHRKILFKAEVAGKTKYYSRGKEVTASKYKNLSKAEANRQESKVKVTAGFGRGWHFKDRFVAPNGDVYNKGKLHRRARQSRPRPSKKGKK